VCPGHVSTSMQDRELVWGVGLRNMTAAPVRAEYVSLTARSYRGAGGRGRRGGLPRQRPGALHDRRGGDGRGVDGLRGTFYSNVIT
jgi:hypothetical protein